MFFFFFKIRHLNDIKHCICGCWEFQVTGRESLKKERPSRPVKIAESDADVSESLWCQHLKKLPVYPSLSFP